MESVRLRNNAELERWCRAKILAALDRWQDEEISRRLATEKRRTKRKTESAPASPGWELTMPSATHARTAADRCRKATFEAPGSLLRGTEPISASKPAP